MMAGMVTELKAYRGVKIYKVEIAETEQARKKWGIQAEYYYQGAYGESEHFLSLKECREAIREYE